MATKSRLGYALKVNINQKGNPILSMIKQQPWEYGTLSADYQVGQSNCILFLSLKYHRLHPEYIFTRFRDIKDAFLVRILLVLVDVDSNQQSLRELSKLALDHGITVVLAWSQEDCAKYLETFKAFEHKPPDALREHMDGSNMSKLTSALSQIRTVNKTDVVTLTSNFKSFHDIINAPRDQLAMLPGFGEAKVDRLTTAFDASFLSAS